MLERYALRKELNCTFYDIAFKSVNLKDDARFTVQFDEHQTYTIDIDRSKSQ